MNISALTAKLRLAIVLVAAALLAGCAAMEAAETRDTEQLLAAAGFTQQLADTPEKLAHLQTLTQHQIVPHSKDGVTHYVYADAAICKCLFMGDQKAHQRFQELALQQRMVEQQVRAAEINRDAAMNWILWRPFRRW